MEHIKISRLEVMIPMLDEVYVQGKDGVKNIHDDGDGYSVIYDDHSVLFFTNSVPLKIDWEAKRYADVNSNYNVRTCNCCNG